MNKRRISNLVGPLLLIAAQYLNQIIGPLVSLLVVRYLGAEQFGLYASALGIITLLSVLPDFGLQQAALNMNAKKRWRMADILKRSFKYGLFYACITYGVVAIWVEAIDYALATRVLCLILGLTFFRIAIVTVLNTGLQIRGEYGRIALWNGLIGSSQWVGTLIAIAVGLEIYWLILGPLLATMLTASIMLVVEGGRLKLWQRTDRKKAEIGHVPSSELIKGSWQFGLASSMHQLYFKSDVVVLSVFRAPIEVGYYTLAFRLIELFFLFPGVVFNQVLYPKYCVWIRERLEKLRWYYGMMNKVMIVSGMAATFGLVLFGQELIRILFGEAQRETIQCLLVLAISIPLRFWVSSAGAVLTNDKLIVVKLKIQSVVAIINVGLNVAFIPKFGIMAAAINMIVTHFILLGAYSYSAHRHLFGFGRIAKADWLPAAILFMAGLAMDVLLLNLSGIVLRLISGFAMGALLLGIAALWFRGSVASEAFHLIRQRKGQSAEAAP